MIFIFLYVLVPNLNQLEGKLSTLGIINPKHPVLSFSFTEWTVICMVKFGGWQHEATDRLQTLHQIIATF